MLSGLLIWYIHFLRLSHSLLLMTDRNRGTPLYILEVKRNSVGKYTILFILKHCTSFFDVGEIETCFSRIIGNDHFHVF